MKPNSLVISLPSPLEEIHDPAFKKAGARLYLKRDDRINPDVPGNKWRKLHLNVEEAKSQGYHSLLTFGGAYSNHLRAVAAAGKIFGFNTIGIVRGEEHTPLNWSLQYAKNHGMKLHYVTREDYRHKAESQFITELHKKFGEFYLLPEGGSNTLAVRGCAEIPKEITVPFDIICCPAGTGGTLAGIAAGLTSGQTAIGFSALRGGDFLKDDVLKLQKETYGTATSNWKIETNYHFGGFAKNTPELQRFIKNFVSHHGITLERIYVAKMLFGIFDLVKRGDFTPGTTIIAVITGPAERT